MVSAGLNKFQNSWVYYHAPSFLLTLPILVQLLFTSNQLIYSKLGMWLSILVIYFCWYMLSIGFIYLLRIKFKYLALPIFFSFVAATYMIVTGENIEYEVWASINNTNSSEAIELLLSPMFSLPFIFLFLFLLLTYKYLLTDKVGLNKKPYLSKNNSLILIVIASIGFSYCYVYEKGALYKTYPLNIPYFQKMYLTELYFFKKRFNQIKYKLPVDVVSKEGDVVYILVIGESARKQSMSVYGYLRDTTPKMKMNIEKNKLKSFVFDATSSSIATRQSVPMLLSTVNTKNYNKLSLEPSLIHVFNALNYKTTLISNQETSGRNNDIISLMFGDMRNKYYISDDSVSNEKLNWSYDIDLIPYLENSINGENKKDFIIIHLMGSHWDYSRRYPERFSIFNDGLVGSYDNSIRYTDHVIGKLTDLINASHRPVALIYTSDHGDNLNDSGDGNYLHAVKDMTEFEVKVPFLITFNDKFVKENSDKVNNVFKNNNKKVSHDNIAHTFLGLADLYDPSIYKKEYDLSSDWFEESARYAINRMREVVDVDKYLSEKSRK